MHKEQINEEELYEGLEGLMEMLRDAPAQRLTILNKSRYLEATNSARQIISYIKEDCPDAEVKISFDDFTGTTMVLEIVLPVLNIYNVSKFFKMAESANTMDVYARLDSSVVVNFGYNDVRLIAPPIE